MDFLDILNTQRSSELILLTYLIYSFPGAFAGEIR